MLTDTQMLDFAVAVSRVFEVAGIVVILIGALAAAVRFGTSLVGAGWTSRPAARRDAVSAFRKTLGLSILAGLELLVAADIIRTVSVEPSMESVLVLGVIVLIRTFLSLSLEVEINGTWPWRSKQEEGTKATAE